MAVTAKFILNRDEKNFSYVEKIETKKDVKFHIYHDNKGFTEYNINNFYDIYGVDAQLSIKIFVELAKDKLIHGCNDDKTKQEAYEVIEALCNNPELDKNKSNPNINTMPLVLATSVYNQMLEISEEPLLDYESEYTFIENLKQKNQIKEKETLLHEYDKTHVYSKQYSEMHEKGIERRIKYDN